MVSQVFVETIIDETENEAQKMNNPTEKTLAEGIGDTSSPIDMEFIRPSRLRLKKT